MRATELGVPLATPAAFSNLRGLHDPLGDAAVGQVFGYGGDAFKSLYGVAENDDEMRSRLLCGAQVPKDGTNKPSYADVAGGIGNKSTVDYANEVLGSAGARYFFDNNRFRADFTADVDAVGYLEHAVVDYYAAGATKYPIPGFSALVNRMKGAIEHKGGRIFLSEPVSRQATKARGPLAPRSRR